MCLPGHWLCPSIAMAGVDPQPAMHPGRPVSVMEIYYQQSVIMVRELAAAKARLVLEILR